MAELCPACGLRDQDTPSGLCSPCVIAHAAVVWQATNSPILLSVIALPKPSEPTDGDPCPGCGIRSPDRSGLCTSCQSENAVADYIQQRTRPRKGLWDRRRELQGVA